MERPLDPSSDEAWREEKLATRRRLLELPLADDCAHVVVEPFEGHVWVFSDRGRLPAVQIDRARARVVVGPTALRLSEARLERREGRVSLTDGAVDAPLGQVDDTLAAWLERTIALVAAGRFGAIEPAGEEIRSARDREDPPLNVRFEERHDGVVSECPSADRLSPRFALLMVVAFSGLLTAGLLSSGERWPALGVLALAVGAVMWIVRGGLEPLRVEIDARTLRIGRGRRGRATPLTAIRSVCPLAKGGVRITWADGRTQRLGEDWTWSGAIELLVHLTNARAGQRDDPASQDEVPGALRRVVRATPQASATLRARSASRAASADRLGDRSR